MPVSAFSTLDDLLDRADHVVVAVETEQGPHVTPELFAVQGDRIWCMAAAPTLKARLLPDRPRAGILVRSGGDVAVLAADAVVVDPARPLAALAAGADAVRAPAVVAAFLARNHLEMTGAVIDAASLQLGTPPPRRVLLGFDPVAAVVLRGDDLLVGDGWAVAAGAPARGGNGQFAVDDVPVDDVPLDDTALEDLPGELGSLLRSEHAVLGWTSPTGPLALPALWAHDDRLASVASPLFDTVEAMAAGPCSLMVDGWTGLGPTGKRGVMLRGDGESDRDGTAVRVRVAADRATYWEGIDTGTVSSAQR